MEFLLLGFFTSLSLILAIGAQNIFVIEQGLKKKLTIFAVAHLLDIPKETVRRKVEILKKKKFIS